MLLKQCSRVVMSRQVMITPREPWFGIVSVPGRDVVSLQSGMRELRLEEGTPMGLSAAAICAVLMMLSTIVGGFRTYGSVTLTLAEL